MCIYTVYSVYIVYVSTVHAVYRYINIFCFDPALLDLPQRQPAALSQTGVGQ